MLTRAQSRKALRLASQLKALVPTPPHETAPGNMFGNSDPGMSVADWIAGMMPPPKACPDCLDDPEAVARIVEFAEANALPLVLPHWPDPWDLWALFSLYDRAFEAAAKRAFHMQELRDLPLNERKLSLLVLWSACMSAAKTIAYKTRSGVNTPELRRRIFRGLDSRAKGTKLYIAGMMAAPAFKRGRRQKIYLEGVPMRSPVRRFA